MKVFGFPWTIRTRLTLLYGGAFFFAGTGLIIVVHLYLGQVLDRQFTLPLEGGIPVLRDLPPLASDQVGPVDLLLQRARLNTLDTMLVASFGLVGILTVLAALIGWLVAGQALRPLRDITATARRVADRSLHERINLTGPQDELKDLAETLDAMLERLDRSFDSQRRFVANASHELRTPLTIARTLIEVALLDAETDEKFRQFGTTLLAVNQRHEKLIDGLLTLATGEQSAADLAPVDLGEIVEHVLSEMHPLAERAGVVLKADLRPCVIEGEAFLLERLIQNLVENAIQYNSPENGWVRVQTGTEAGTVDLVVENIGPVVPAHEVPGLFEPFRRLAGTERLAGTARGSMIRGAGLGLSIVRSVAQTHAGDVQASARKEGGLIVHIRFPAALTAT